ncbi:hypothetical protein O181_014876 [Austropuccinia psidii MF-1]|uniref:Reverse transcriptase Ty1/copia-type domain-containing protein n=1 Tax=Austropuccinia psidii MF-1 TaxID=1389203 RepID=A0A9Q3C2K3_9BASI|nr:hypothetical protein [Austropuccinia psidii MF-1]
MEQLFDIQPDPTQLFPFGARAIVHVPQEKRTKLDARATECILLTYLKSGKGWTFLNVPSFRIFTLTSAIFPDYQHLPIATPTKKGAVAFILNHLRLSEIQQALKSNLSVHWKTAAEAELQQFDEWGVWEAISPVANMKILGAKWVFVVKRTASGQVDKFKARYVARGFSQRPGIDCSNLYAPTASLNLLRLLLKFKVKFNLHMAGFNVSVAYLYSPIEEDILVQAPVELQPDLSGKVMKLREALHGTKQAARCWWQYSCGIMGSLGFHGDKIEPSIYIFKKCGVFFIVWVHVNNGIVLSNSAGGLDSFKTKLTLKFKFHWSDHVSKIVGLNIDIGNGRLDISQPLLSKQLLDDYHRPIRDQFTTLPDSLIVTNKEKSVDQTRYQSILGSLMYLSLGSQPDITFAVNLLARFSSNPGLQHWEALDHLIGYLCHHRHQPLIYEKKDQGLSLWTNANWGGEHKRSTSGFMVKAFGNLIAWGSKCQHVVAMSTCASEYVALVEGTQLLAYIRLLAEPILLQLPLTIHCDNKAVIMIVEDNLSKKRSKYLDRAFYFVIDFVRQFNVKLQWTPTAMQYADVLTKPLGRVKMGKARASLNLATTDITLGGDVRSIVDQI